MINYNDPLELTVVFRVADNPESPPKEYAAKIACLWEDVKLIEQYPYKDNWREFPGPKYYITLAGDAQTSRLVLGDYHNMVLHWLDLRRTYPLFPDLDQEDDGLDKS